MDIRDRVTELRRVPARDLVANPKNWRRHPEAQRKALRAMLRTVGFASAVLARESDEGLVLIDGHLRADLDADAVIPVLVLDVTEDEADQLLATIDPLAAMALTDQDALGALLGQVEIPSADLAAHVQGLAGTARHRGQTDPDDVPVIDDPVTQVGDLWVLGEHRIACADSSIPEHVAAVLGGGRAEMLFTDPPYGVSYRGSTEERLTIANDALSPEALEELLTRCFTAAASALAPGAAFYVCSPATAAQELAFLLALKAAGLRTRQQLVWVKDRFTLTRSDYQWRHEGLMQGDNGDEPVPVRDPRDDWAWRHESMVYGWAHGVHEFNGDRRQDTVWEIARPPSKHDHPTIKPVELVARAIALSSAPGAVVLDPFLGSGSTLIACQQLERTCAGIDIDPLYVDRAVRRWEEFTGLTAERREAAIG